MERTFEQTISDLRMLLRDQDPSTTADVTDGAGVYLAGNELRGVFLSADELDGLDQPFKVDPWFVGQVEENLAEWFCQPRFTHRPSLRAWALDAPPAEAAD
jgi:hypothetical protein